MFRIRQIGLSDDAFFNATTCLFIMALQLMVYFTHPINPILARDDIGWGHWYDQGQYLRSLQALADISEVQPVSFTIALDWPWRRSGAALTAPQ